MAGCDAAVAVGWDEAHVGDTVYVPARVELCWVVQDQGVEEDDQGSVLAASGLIAYADVGDGVDIGAGGEDGAFGHCEGALCLA